MAMAVDREDVQVATDTLGVLTAIHEAKFGPTPMNQKFKGALRCLEVAGYVTTFIDDPRRGISEAVSGELVGAMNINPVLFGLNVAGDVAVAILPTLHKTADGLKGHSDETYEEYLEAIAPFEILAAYRQGVTRLAESVGDGVASMIMDVRRFSKLAIEKGEIPKSMSEAKKEELIEGAAELGQQLGESLQGDERVKPLVAEYSSSISLGAVTTSGLSTVSSSSTRVTTKGSSFKPSDVKVGFSVFGSTSAGLGAMITVSMPTNLVSLTLGALALVGLAIANIFNKKKHKKHVKKFRKRAAEIDGQIRKMFNETNDICHSDVPDPDKIARLRVIANNVEGYVRHKGVITNRLDDVLGADAARDIGDQFRKILRDLRTDINEKIIPAIEKRQAFIKTIAFIDVSDFVAATACLSSITPVQREFCEAYISLKQGDMSAVSKLERLKGTECGIVVEKLLEQCYIHAAARPYAVTDVFRAAAGAGALGFDPVLGAR